MDGALLLPWPWPWPPPPNLLRNGAPPTHRSQGTCEPLGEVFFFPLLPKESDLIYSLYLSQEELSLAQTSERSVAWGSLLTNRNKNTSTEDRILCAKNTAGVIFGVILGHLPKAYTNCCISC